MVDRDEGMTVRAQWPALIVSVFVSPGQEWPRVTPSSSSRR